MFFVHYSAICNIHKLKRGGGLFRIDPNQKNPNCNSAFFKAAKFFLLPSNGINITLFNISLFYLFECRRYIKLLKLCHTESSRRYAIEYFRSHKKVELKCAARIFNFVRNVVFLTKSKRNQHLLIKLPECFICLSYWCQKGMNCQLPSDTLQQKHYLTKMETL